MSVYMYVSASHVRTYVCNFLSRALPPPPFSFSDVFCYRLYALVYVMYVCNIGIATALRILEVCPLCHRGRLV